MTRWFLASANQFRPASPPAFGSPEFAAALAEIRHISDTRTDQQIEIATTWALNPGTATPPGFWLEQASKEVAAHNLSERAATHVFALVSSTMEDALIACWDGKLTYWLIRPWNADAGITTLASVGEPNHPSYPSGHSCVSSSAAEVLSTFFPERRTDLSAMVIEAGLSRMYAGIHYRFDIDAGQKLGRSVALFAIAADASGSSVLSH
jgi:membrane-associated phospholipid phosphatase